jgi:glutathione peroxidase
MLKYSKINNKKMIRITIIILSIVVLMLISNYTRSVSKPKISNIMNDSKINNDNPNISDIMVKTMDSKDVSLSEYKGKVLMIVNVASLCGNTPQYEGLERIYEKYKDKGFEILAFPCNDFGGQEPGTNEEIKDFCTSKYKVTFTLFDKIKVLGDDKSTLYARLIQTEPAGDVKWNFEKFLIDKNGNVVSRFKSKIKPEDTEITTVIENLLIQ